MTLNESRIRTPGNGDPMHELERGRSIEATRAGRHRVWPWLVVLLVIGAGAYFLYARIHAMNQAKSAAPGRAMAGRPVPVVAAPARKGDMSIYYEGLGTVAAFETVTLHSRVDGQLMKVYYKEGQIVQKGDPLVLIDPRPYDAALEQAQGQLQRDQALLKNAQIDLQRYKSIPESVTPQQVDTQAALVSQYSGTVTTDQAAVDNAKLNIEYCHINAPLTGRIGLRLVDEGNIVHANDPTGLAVITELQPIAVYFSLPEDQIQRVFQQPNQGQGLEVEAFDRNDTRRIATGSLLASDSQIDPGSGTLRFKAVFDNKDYALFPSQFVNTWLLVNTLHDAVIVPTAAVQRGPAANTFVYVVKADKTVELHDVQVGHPVGDERVRAVSEAPGDYTSIINGVAPGDLVVTDGVDKLQQGTTVQVSLAPRTPRRATTRPTTRPANAATRPAAVPMRGGFRGRPAAGSGK